MRFTGALFSCGVLFLGFIGCLAAYDSGVSYKEIDSNGEITREKLLYGASTGDIQVFYANGNPKMHAYKDWSGTQHWVRYHEDGEENEHLTKD